MVDEKAKTMRVSRKFVEELEDIKIQRVKKKGGDKRLKSDRRLTLAIARHPSWKDLKKDLIESPLNKKGQGNILTFVGFAFIVLLIFGIFGWSFGVLTDAVIAIPSDGGLANLSSAGEETFGQVNAALEPGLKIISFATIMGMILLMLVTAFFARKPAVLFVVDILILVIALVISVYVSNVYEGLLAGQPFSATLAGFTAGTSIMLHLPRWITVIGISTIIISMVGIIRRRGETGDVG